MPNNTTTQCHGRAHTCVRIKRARLLMNATWSQLHSGDPEAPGVRSIGGRRKLSWNFILCFDIRCSGHVCVSWLLIPKLMCFLLALIWWFGKLKLMAKSKLPVPWFSLQINKKWAMVSKWIHMANSITLTHSLLWSDPSFTRETTITVKNKSDSGVGLPCRQLDCQK